MLSLLAPAKAAYLFINLLVDWEYFQPKWDRYVEKHPRGSIFHTSPMVRVFEATKGYAPLPLAAVNADGDILAMLVAVRERTNPYSIGAGSSRSIWFAEPLCDDSPEGIAALSGLITHHDRLMRRRALFAEVCPAHDSGPERTALEQLGYQYLDYLNFVVDTTRSSDLVWQDMRESARTSIRKCKTRGLEVRHANSTNSIDQLYKLLQSTYAHANVPLVHRSLFDAAFRILHPLGMFEMIGVYDGDRPIAMDALLRFKNQVIAWYGGSVRMSNLSPVDLLQWHELTWSHDQGCERFDFGGAGWPDIPYGVRDFKAKFGGELVCHGRYRKILSPWKMALAEYAYQFGLPLLGLGQI